MCVCVCVCVFVWCGVYVYKLSLDEKWVRRSTPLPSVNDADSRTIYVVGRHTLYVYVYRFSYALYIVWSSRSTFHQIPTMTLSESCLKYLEIYVMSGQTNAHLHLVTLGVHSLRVTVVCVCYMYM